MQYFEGGRVYDNVPAWVAAMLSFGYHWCDRSSGTRRIALLSMPCESEAAGLVALGAFRRDLELTTTNYIDSYFDLLVRFCRERQAGQKYKVTPPELPSTDIRNVLDNSRWRFAADNSSPDKIVIEDAGYRQFVKRGGKLIHNQNGPCRSYITRENALDWQLHNFPLPQMPPGGSALELAVYSVLPFCSGSILDANLCRSYDGLVLVGQGAARDSSYMQKYYAAGFASGNRQLPLGELLTLHNSEKKYVQRLRFVNERTTDDDGGHSARLVVADGISALLRAEQLYPTSDIIAFCSRDASVEVILQLKGWLNEKMRYYTDLEPSHGFLGETPVGTLLRVLQRRV